MEFDAGTRPFVIFDAPSSYKAWILSRGCRVMPRQRPPVSDGSSWVLSPRVPPSSAAFSFYSDQRRFI